MSLLTHWKDWFASWGDHKVGHTISVEELYQAFLDRLKEETLSIGIHDLAKILASIESLSQSLEALRAHVMTPVPLPPIQPPVDNDHVAEGSTPFPETARVHTDGIQS